MLGLYLFTASYYLSSLCRMWMRIVWLQLPVRSVWQTLGTTRDVLWNRGREETKWSPCRCVELIIYLISEIFYSSIYKYTENDWAAGSMLIYMFSLLVHLYDLITITILYINTLKIIELQAILVIVSIMLVICDIHGRALIWNKDIYLLVLYYYKFDCMSIY